MEYFFFILGLMAGFGSYRLGIEKGRKQKREELKHGFSHILNMPQSKVKNMPDGSMHVSFVVPPEEELVA